MKNRIYTCLIVVIASLAFAAFNRKEDNPFLPMLKEKLFAFLKINPEEKVYLHIDKTLYKPGEDIWFNAFLVNSTTHQPSRISDVVYVQLKDPKGNNVSTLELFVQEGTTKGDFHLDEVAPGGLYTLTAYTQWMHNAGEEMFFKKEIQVQKVITPRLLLKLDFEKEAYGAGDEVSALITVTDLKNEKAKGAVADAKIKIAGKEIHSVTAIADAEGKAQIRFNLPNDLQTTDGLLQVLISYNGTQESITRSIPIVLNKITLQLFPEGGDLVAGVTSNVGIKAVNEFGKGADVTGVVIDENNTVVTTFESFHMGMGALTFTPQAGKAYRAKITKPQGNETLVPLPAALPEGFSLSVNQQKAGEIEWNIHAPLTGEIFLVAQVQGALQCSEKLVVKKGSNLVRVPTQQFPAGIAVFTLFNQQGMEECERLVFVNKQKGLHIQLSTDKKDYAPREEVTLKVRTTDAGGRPLPAKLSLAVVDDQLLSFADDKQDNILSWLMMSSELRTPVQEPSFYFDEQEPKADRALDYLLMTQGWRRFTWKDVLKNEKRITYAPENSGSISGSVHNGRSKTRQAEVFLLESGNRKRIARVKTTEDGQFIFKNVDASVPILLLTKKPGELGVHANLKGNNPGPRSSRKSKTPGADNVFETEETGVANNAEPVEDNTSVAQPAEMNMSLDEDVSQLSEVVIVGYGREEKSSLVGSISTIRVHDNPIENVGTQVAMENLLQGRVAGVQVQQQNGNPGAQASLRLRGISSLAAGNGQPLYVIDGHPVHDGLNKNFSSGSMIGPDDIESIEIMSSPEATALFGSAAANGVIMITTKSRIFYNQFREHRRKPKYASLLIMPRNFSATREFYVAPPFAKKLDDERNDFRSTVYWNHTVVTDKNGEAVISFYNNDAASAFRIVAEGISGTGLAGRKEKVYSTKLPFSIDAKLPNYLGFEDTLRIPVMIRNTTSSAFSGKFAVDVPEEALRLPEGNETTVTVPANSTATRWVTIVPNNTEGEFPVHITLEGNNFKDDIRQTLSVHPVGFPARMSFSGKELENTVQLTMRDVEKGSVKAELQAYPDVLSDLFTGAESILHEPHGCFEQVSSSTFPNILALQFLKQSGEVRPETEKKALNFIKSGYKQLTAYEIKGGGFEWFGRPPAHEALSAYGLIEFTEMKKVFDGVDEKLINRTREWLLSRRAGNGTFKQNRGKYGFSGASEEVNNAYLVYALAETGTTSIDPEYRHSLDEAWKSRDMYRMALLASAAYDLNKIKDYQALVKHFAEESNATGLDRLKVSHSIVWSQGTSLKNETVSLWALALLKSPQPDLELINRCIQFISLKRSFGMFGSTQATTLCLKALTEYAKFMRAKRESGEIVLAVNDQTMDVQAYSADRRQKIVMSNFEQSLKEGDHRLTVRFNKTQEPLPYTVNIAWNTRTPASNNECKVEVSTALKERAVKVNETVRLTATLRNKTRSGLPMSVALIGIPAGLSLQPWQLKELQEKEAFDFYEVLGNRLAIYYRELPPEAVKTIHLDLKAEVAGTFTGIASSAYLYYTDEHKHWEKGVRIRVE